MTRNWMTLILTPLLDAVSDGSGSGSAGAVADASAAGTTGSNNGQAAGATNSDAGSRTGAASTGFTYKEDRSDWVPKHRFNEVNTQAQKAKEYETQLKDRDAKIAALAGLTAPDPQAAKADEVKKAFLQMFPHLSDEQIKKLEEQAAKVEVFEQREWARVGKNNLTSLYSKVADEFGTEALNDEQKADLRESFSAWFKRQCQTELQASGGNSSKTLQRYEDGDPSLLEEFSKRYTANWIEPARRKVTQQSLTRVRPVVNSGGRGSVSTTAAPKFKTLDERIDYAAGRVFEGR